MLAALVSWTRDFDLAEDVVQEAFAIAAERWPREGAPRNPGAWLVTTARHRAVDRLRRERVLAEKTAGLSRVDELDEPPPLEGSIPDERLELIFTCCHPALALEARVALTLRAVGGLSTDEIARAFLTSSETMKRRLSRAKLKIREIGIPFRVPPAHLLPERLKSVLAVVYLIFNEGYSGRVDLGSEAIRLGRVLAALLPAEPEVHGLLALMLFHDARRAARFSGDDLVLLADQDRSKWDHAQLDEARSVLSRAQPDGLYSLQAHIARLHTAESIDWPRIADLYARLAGKTRSPVMELNRAVAVAESGELALALEIVERLDLTGYQYWHSTRAELLRRLGRLAHAREAYRRAMELSHRERERRFLRAKLEELE